MDRFGKDVALRPDDNEHFKLITDVMVSPQFFGWLFSLGEGTEIVAPADIREQFVQSLWDLSTLYTPNEKGYNSVY